MKSETETTNAPGTTADTPPTPSARHRSAVTPARRALAGDVLLVFIVALAVRLVWTLILPPWQAIDETEHFSYVNHITEQGRLPSRLALTADPDYSQELQRSLENTSFYPLVRVEAITAAVTPVLDPGAYAGARGFSANGTARDDSGRSRATDYPPLYYLILSIPDRLLHAAPITSRLFAMRIVSGAFGALTCLFAYLIAYDLFGSRRWGWCAGLCAAFMPAFAHTSASVNNDALMDLLAAALVWYAVRAILRKRVTRELFVGVFICIVLLLLTKPSAIPVMIIVAIIYVGIAWLYWRQRTRGTHFGAAPWIALGIGVALVPIGWFSLQQVAVANHFPLLNAFVGNITLSSPPKYSLLSYFIYLLSSLGRIELWTFYWTFWGWFGWGFAALPMGVWYLTVPICLVGVVGVVLRAIHRPSERHIWFLFLALIFGQLIFLLVGVEYRLTFEATGEPFGLTGRYLYPVLVPILLAILAGWAYLFRDSSRLLRCATLAMFALQLMGWSAVLTRYYDVMIGGIR